MTTEIRDDLLAACGDYVQQNTTDDDRGDSCPVDSAWVRRVQLVAATKGVDASLDECCDLVNAFRQPN